MFKIQNVQDFKPLLRVAVGRDVSQLLGMPPRYFKHSNIQIV
jgi:hypothetical protein